MLFPSTESAIPVDILIAWERSPEKKQGNHMSNILKFLRKVKSGERMIIAQNFNTEEKSKPTAACLLAGTDNTRKKVRVWTAMECYTV